MRLSIYFFLIFLSVSQAFGQSLIAGYSFTKDYGDSSGYNNHGTNYGTVFIRDRCFNDSSAIELDGINDYVNLGQMDSLSDNLDNFSISLWFKSKGPKSTWESIFKVLNNAGNGNAISFEINRGSNSSYTPGNLNLYLRDVSGSALSLVIYEPAINDCEWHHLVWVVHNSSINTYSIYLDGVQRTSLPGYSTGGPSSFSGFQYNFLLGAANNRGSIQIYFKGTLDDIRFYSGSLSSTQALQLYESPCTFDTCYYTDTITVYEVEKLTHYDTTHINVFDTTVVYKLDTMLVYVIDTFYQTIYDTTHVTYNDTATHIVYDTTFVTHHDTVYSYINTAVQDTLVFKMYTENCGDVIHKIYPNPASKSVYLYSNNPDCFEGYHVELITSIGQVLQRKDYSALVSFDVRGYARELYLLRLIGPAGDVAFSKKIIIQ